jgi:drug/metabolite transporter (DMT)-like permease
MSRPDRTHFAAMMLLLATVFWACSFTLSKHVGDVFNHSTAFKTNSSFGPIAAQGIRFLIASFLFFAIFPASRRGWTRAGVLRGTYTGVLLAGGILLQNVALDLTTPATTAFLTSLSVLWVPLLACVFTRKLPDMALLIGVALAAVGLYLLLGEGLTQLRKGEMLGLACSIVLTFHLLAVSRVVRQEDPWRMCGAQFLVCGVVSCVVAMVVGPSWDKYGPIGTPFYALVYPLASPEIAWRFVLLLIFPTILAFGMMNVYQPRVDPTRAVLIYMAEPVLASLFDYLMTSRSLTALGMVGAALIVGANLLAELAPRTKQES